MSITDEETFSKIFQGLTSTGREYLQSAYNLAQKAHEGQKRKSGEPYFIHPLAVAVSLWKKFGDVELTAAGLLHDAVEDCEWLKIGRIYTEFGSRVGYIVDSVSKTEKTFYESSDEFDDERDKILAGGMSRIGCILVKLADREHNLATLKYMPAHKQVKKSFESQSLYIPLMHIIGYNEEGASVESCEKKFHEYIQENDLRSFKSIKNNLLNICFQDFNEELFNVVYNNSTSVVWKLEDKDVYRLLLTQPGFESSISVVSMSATVDTFIVLLQFINGYTFDQIVDQKFKVGNIYNGSN